MSEDLKIKIKPEYTEEGLKDLKNALKEAQKQLIDLKTKFGTKSEWVKAEQKGIIDLKSDINSYKNQLSNQKKQSAEESKRLVREELAEEKKANEEKKRLAKQSAEESKRLGKEKPITIGTPEALKAQLKYFTDQRNATKIGSQEFDELTKKIIKLKKEYSEIKVPPGLSRAQLLEMGENLSVVMAGVGALVGKLKDLGTSVINIALEGAGYGVLKKAFEDLSGGIKAGKENLELFKYATAGALNEKAIIEFANKMMELGYNTQETAQIMELAKTATDKFGGTIEGNADKLLRFIETGKGKGIYQMGIDIGNVTKKMADLGNVTEDGLKKKTEEEQQTLRMRAVFELYGMSLDNIKKKQKDNADIIESIKTAYENAKLKIGEILGQFAKFFQILDNEKLMTFGIIFAGVTIGVIAMTGAIWGLVIASQALNVSTGGLLIALGVIITGVSALTYLIFDNWNEVKKWTYLIIGGTNNINLFKDAIHKTKDTIIKFGKDGLAYVKPMLQSFSKTFGDIIKDVGTFLRENPKLIKGLQNVADTGFKFLKKEIQGVIFVLNGFITGVRLTINVIKGLYDALAGLAELADLNLYDLIFGSERKDIAFNKIKKGIDEIESGFKKTMNNEGFLDRHLSRIEELKNAYDEFMSQKEYGPTRRDYVPEEKKDKKEKAGKEKKEEKIQLDIIEEKEKKLKELREESIGILAKYGEQSVVYLNSLSEIAKLEKEITDLRGSFLDSIPGLDKIVEEVNKLINIPEEKQLIPVPKPDELAKLTDEKILENQMKQEMAVFNMFDNVVANSANVLGSFFQSLASGDEKAFKNFMKNIVVTFISSIQAMLFAAKASLLAKGITSFGLSMIIDAPLLAAAWVALEVAKGVIGGLEKGGKFTPGAYIVGERGPEIAVFNRPGYMINNKEAQTLISRSKETGNNVQVNTPIFIKADIDGIKFFREHLPKYRDFAMNNELS